MTTSFPSTSAEILVTSVLSPEILLLKTILIHLQEVVIIPRPPRPPLELAVHDLAEAIDDGEIMGVRHKDFIVEGVQFHPESILSEQGHALLKNFLQLK